MNRILISIIMLLLQCGVSGQQLRAQTDEGILFRVSRPGMKAPSYLMGSMPKKQITT